MTTVNVEALTHREEQKKVFNYRNTAFNYRIYEFIRF